MTWFWGSRSRQLLAQQAAIESLQVEVDRLQSTNAATLKAQAEWQASAEAARNERDAHRDEAEQLLSAERQRFTDELSVLNQQLVESQSDLKMTRNELDAARQSAAEISRDRDARTRQKDQLILELEGEIAAISRQLIDANEIASSQITLLEQRLTGEADLATTRIALLEDQLAESEERSTKRASQRSALLRNLAEIHKLSKVLTKGEELSDSLKLINSDWATETDAVADTSCSQGAAFKPFQASPNELSSTESA